VPTMIIKASPTGSGADELESAAQALFAALDERRPDGLAYYSLREADGNYLIVLQIPGNAENPLPAFPEFLAFQAGLPGWLAEPARPAPAHVVGAYGTLTA